MSPDALAAPVVAVVPLRDGRSGKTRLAASLSDEDRGALVVALARHVVSTLVAARDVTQVLVVSEAPTSARGALDGIGGPVQVVRQPTQRPGLDAAVDVGRRQALRDAPVGRLLVVHADLPALEPDDVAALLEAARLPDAQPSAVQPSPAQLSSAQLSSAQPSPAGWSSPAQHGAVLGGRDLRAGEPGRWATGIALATDRAGTGTNAVVLDPVDTAFAFRFGEGSLAAHRAEAAGRGLVPMVVRRTGTACDLDTVADWWALPEPVRRRVVRAVPAMDRLPAGG